MVACYLAVGLGLILALADDWSAPGWPSALVLLAGVTIQRFVAPMVAMGIEIVDNLQQHITEAQGRRWLGEVQGLQISLDAATAKLAALDRAAAATAPGPTLLGLPARPG